MHGDAKPRIIEDIVTQHAEEAAFLWLLRDAAVRQPHYDLSDLAELDERVEAHLDGLRIAGEGGWAICEQALEIGEPGEIFTAAVLAFEGENGARVDNVVTVGSLAEETTRALVSALGWLSDSQVRHWISRLIAANSPTYRRLGIAACAIHRIDPGSALAVALDDPESRFQSRALRAVGELKRRDLLPALHTRFKAEDSGCRFWAAWSAALLGERKAVTVLEAFSSVDNPYRERAMDLLLRIVDTKHARGFLTDLSKYPEALRHVIRGTCIVGDPVAIPWLVQQMDNAEHARVAGEAISMITGVDIAYEDLEGEWPAEYEAGPTENPEDEDVAMDVDEDLPWPDGQRVLAWWEGRKQTLVGGNRYLCGEPINVQHCEAVLRTGFQRQRRAAALELGLRQGDAPLFNVSAPGFRQQSALAKLG